MAQPTGRMMRIALTNHPTVASKPGGGLTSQSHSRSRAIGVDVRCSSGNSFSPATGTERWARCPRPLRNFSHHGNDCRSRCAFEVAPSTAELN